MIEFRKGNMLESDAEALVNTVNCVGVMGRGIALQFKKAFPDNFKAYEAACQRKEVQPGRMFVFETCQLTNPRYIINFPTKQHWRGKSRLEDIESGLDGLVEEIRSRNIQSIAIPPLGSGLGGLNWSDVRERIQDALASFADVDIIVYEPGGVPELEKAVRSRSVPNMTPGRAALVVLMERYLRGLLDPFVSLLEVHKLMYFMQEAGQPLKLKYKKALYGPYAENMRHVLIAIEGHMVRGYSDGGDAPDKLLELVTGVVEEARKVIEAEKDTLVRFDRVADLVTGFESSFGLELLSTVHWLLMHETPESMEQLIKRTYAWNERKQRFSRRQIELAADVLVRKRWNEPISH